jgi:hypothetical protein
MDEKIIFDLMHDKKFKDFLSFLINDLAGIYCTNSKACPYSEGKRSVGLDVRFKLQSTANKYKTDYPEFGIFYERAK